jgi:hypothetical protein
LLKFTMIAAVLSLASLPALADYKAEYKAYMAAIEAGDLPAALKYGEAAWRAAETELGTAATTAVLAYNYAALAGPFLPERAIEPYERALALTLKGYGELSVIDIKVRIAEAEVRMNESAAINVRKDRVDALEALLESHPELATESPEAYARGWRTYAAQKLDFGRNPQARRAADIAIAAASTLEPPDRQLYVDTLIIGAIARLTSKFRETQDVVEAVALLNRSFALFPPQKDIDSFDRQLAMAMSWRLSVYALALNLDSASFRTGTRLVRGDEFARALESVQTRPSPEALFKWSAPLAQNCSTELSWEDRESPVFPRADLNKGNIGAIIIGYDLNESGIDRTVILSDFTGTGFREVALRTMLAWRLKRPPPAECRKNHIQLFTFAIVR